MVGEEGGLLASSSVVRNTAAPCIKVDATQSTSSILNCCATLPSALVNRYDGSEALARGRPRAGPFCGLWSFPLQPQPVDLLPLHV